MADAKDSLQFELLQSLRKLSKDGAVQVLSAMHRMNEARDKVADKLGVRPPAADLRATLSDLFYHHAQLHSKGLEAVMGAVPGDSGEAASESRRVAAGQTAAFTIRETCMRYGGADVAVDVTPLMDAGGRRVKGPSRMAASLSAPTVKLHEDAVFKIEVDTKGLRPGGSYAFEVTLSFSGGKDIRRRMQVEVRR